MKEKKLKSEIVDVAEQGIVTIAISKFDNRDSYDDIVRKGAFKKTFEEAGHRIKHVMDHTLRQMYVVGLPLKMWETDSHAMVESKLNLEKQIARDLYSDYKFFKDNGRTLEHSFMYETLRKNVNKEIKGEDIAELKMYEYSTVALGANPETPLVELKSFESALEDMAKLEEYLRKYDVSETKAGQIEAIILMIKELKKPGSPTSSEPPKALTPDPNAELYIKKLEQIRNRK